MAAAMAMAKAGFRRHWGNVVNVVVVSYQLRVSSCQFPENTGKIRKFRKIRTWVL